MIQQRLGTADADRFSALVSRWPVIVGPAWAEYSEPLAITRRVLRISVREPALAEQFKWARNDLVRATNQVLGEDLVESLLISVDNG